MQNLKIFSFFIHNQYAHISKTKAMFASIEKKEHLIQVMPRHMNLFLTLEFHS